MVEWDVVATIDIHEWHKK